MSGVSYWKDRAELSPYVDADEFSLLSVRDFIVKT